MSQMMFTVGPNILDTNVPAQNDLNKQTRPMFPFQKKKSHKSSRMNNMSENSRCATGSNFYLNHTAAHTAQECQ